MKNLFKEFLKVNTKFDFHKNPNKILIIDRSRDFASILNSIFGIALGTTVKKNSIILSSKENQRSIDIFKSFGFKNFIYSKNLYTNFNFIIILAKSIFTFILNIVRLKFYGFDWFTKKFCINGIPFGDLIYDYYVRNDQSYINLEINFKFLRVFFISIIKIYNSFKILDKYKFEYILVSTAVYATYSGIISRIGIYKNIKIIEPHLVKNKRNLSYVIYNPKRKKYYTYDSVVYSNLKKNFLSKTKNLKNNILDNFLSKRFKGKIITTHTTYHDIINLKKYKTKINRDSLIKKFGFKKNEIKKIIVIAPHAFSDTSHNDGKILFIDYYHHFIETIKYVSKLKSKNILWLVREHPSANLYGEKGLVEKIFKKYKNKYLKICPKTNSENLINICDHAVTCTGRIALEFATVGKKSIMGGINDISEFGFFDLSYSKEQYFLKLKNAINIKNLSKDQTTKAKKLLYFLDTLKPLKFISPGNLLGSEMLEKFAKTKIIITKSLINNLKKTTFYEDIFFKDLIKKISSDKKITK